MEVQKLCAQIREEKSRKVIRVESLKIYARYNRHRKRHLPFLSEKNTGNNMNLFFLLAVVMAPCKKDHGVNFGAPLVAEAPQRILDIIFFLKLVEGIL